MKIKFKDIYIAAAVLLIILFIVLPLPTIVTDTLLVINIAISLIILITTLFITEPLQFSVFPSLLLLTTMYRLTLNITTTKLILGNGGDAGNVIKTFGGFVIGGNIVVGVIIFVIIVLVNFLVITKGAERVAEVAARFTLDAMPGKQMAIDADLNSGLIDEQEAKDRRLKIQRESDFYGAMDGASKFVKGDAIMGIIITLVNIVGGIIIGMVTGEMELGEVVTTYVMATVGDGLVGQIPALMISTAMGIIVTRSSSEDNMGADIRREMFGQPVVLMIVGVTLILLGLVPGMPKLPIFALGALMITMGALQYRAAQTPEPLPEESPDELAEEAAEEKRKPENVATLLQVDPIEMEFGYGIIPLVDASQGGDLLDRVVMIRRQCALDMGIIVPVIRLRDNIQLGTNDYVIKIKGVEVARGQIMPDHYLALNPGNATGTLDGIETIEPAFGLPAMWVNETERERADMLGYTTIDMPSVIATHLTEIIKRYGYELLSRQQVQQLMDNLAQQQPALVEEVVPKMFGLGEVQKVLGNLLREGVPIRDMGTIIETLGDYGSLTHDTDLLTEYVRQSLKRTITRRFVPDGRARVITLDAMLEQMILERVRQTDQGSYVAMEPDNLQNVFINLRAHIERLTDMGISPIVLTSPAVRRHFKQMTEQLAPDLGVLSYNEVESDVEIVSDGVVSISG